MAAVTTTGRRTAAPGSRPHALRLRLDGDRFAALEHAAAELGVNAEQLAAIWLAERLSAEAESQAVLRAAADLRDIRGSLHLLVEELDGGAAATAGGAVGARSRGRRPAPRRSSLHAEIVAVLRERGEPLSAAEIAQAIRTRGTYHPPRSGAITGAAVSRRIANPYYRALFVRNGRRVALARSRPDPS